MRVCSVPNALIMPPLRAPTKPALRAATLSKGGGVDPILAAFADGTDGFYFDFSKTDRLFQAQFGALADDPGENIGVALESHAWGGRALAQLTELVPDGSFSTGISQVVAARNAVLSWDGSQRLKVEHGGTGEPQGRITLAATSGVPVLIAFDVVAGSSATALVRIYAADGTTVLLSSGSLSAGSYYAVVTPTGSTSYLSLGANTSTLGAFTLFDNVSVKEIPGNHALQATTSFQPKWQTGGLARFYGSDDILSTPLTPSNTGMTLLAKAKLAATGGNRGVMGVNGADGVSRCFLAFDASGFAAGGVGSDSLSVIKGSVNRAGAYCVLGLTIDSTTWQLYEQGVQTNSGVKNGSCNTTLGIPVASLNANGTYGTFLNADVTHALAIKKALTAAQIAAITNKWGTS